MNNDSQQNTQTAVQRSRYAWFSDWLYKEVRDPDEHIHGIQRARFFANFFTVALRSTIAFSLIALLVRCAKHY